MMIPTTSATHQWHGRWRFAYWPWMAALLLMVLVFPGGCASTLPKATIQMIDEAEARWQIAPVQSYEITVEVDRPDDRRRTTVIVEQGEIIQGLVSYWDSSRNQWNAPYELNREQAFPFTVPGLFDMVREQLEESGRQDVRVQMEGEPPFPQRIVLGPVFLEGQPISGTETTVSVNEFTPR